MGKMDILFRWIIFILKWEFDSVGKKYFIRKNFQQPQKCRGYLHAYIYFRPTTTIISLRLGEVVSVALNTFSNSFF